MRKNILLLLSLICCLSCRSRSESSPMLATVNGEIISVADFEKALSSEQWKFGGEMGFTSERMDEVKQKIMEQMLKDRLLLQEAKKQGVEISTEELQKALGNYLDHYSNAGDFEKFLQLRGMTLEHFKADLKQILMMRKWVEKVVAEQVSLSDNDLQNYYRNHSSDFVHSEQVRARQIVTDSGEKAAALREQLKAGASFETLARKHSLSPERKSGGDLGWFSRGTMPPEFDAVCFFLKPGEISEVVQTPYGFHLFKVTEVRAAGQELFDAVRENIREILLLEKGRESFEKWYQALRVQAKIVVDTKRYEKIQ